MAKHDRILSLFPAFHSARETTKLLYHVVRALAEPVEAADMLLFRIQRAHRLRVAEHADDIVRLAALLNLDPVHFADILARTGVPYERRLDSMRRRVQRVAEIHLDGLGTPGALLAGAAVFLDADLVPSAPDAPLVHHLDAGGWSHWSAIEYAQAPRGTRARVWLHENPLRRRRAEPAPRDPLATWTEDSHDLEPSPARVVIVGVGDRTVLPEIFCPSTGEGVRFHGIVPDGARLVIDASDGASLDGRPVDDWVSFDSGARAEFSAWDQSTFTVERDGAPRRGPFDGDMSRLLTPPYRRRKPTPRVPLGRSPWVFTVELGTFDATSFDFCVFETPAEPRGTYDEGAGFDACAFDWAPSGAAAIGWDERIPCAFKLLVPPRLPVPAAEGATDDASPPEPQWEAIDLGRIGAMLQRFRPAGVRAFIDVARDAWILGESVVRDAGATGEPGLEHQSTRVRDADADLFIPLDPTATAVAS